VDGIETTTVASAQAMIRIGTQPLNRLEPQAFTAFIKSGSFEN